MSFGKEEGREGDHVKIMTPKWFQKKLEQIEYISLPSSHHPKKMPKTDTLDALEDEMKHTLNIL